MAHKYTKDVEEWRKNLARIIARSDDCHTREHAREKREELKKFLALTQDEIDIIEVELVLDGYPAEVFSVDPVGSIVWVLARWKDQI